MAHVIKATRLLTCYRIHCECGYQIGFMPAPNPGNPTDDRMDGIRWAHKAHRSAVGCSDIPSRKPQMQPVSEAAQ